MNFVEQITLMLLWCLIHNVIGMSILFPDKINNYTAKTKCPGERDGLYRYPEDCQKFVVCFYTNTKYAKTAVMQCSHGQVFNEKVMNCDWRWNVPECNERMYQDRPEHPTKPIEKYGSEESNKHIDQYGGEESNKHIDQYGSGESNKPIDQYGSGESNKPIKPYETGQPIKPIEKDGREKSNKPIHKHRSEESNKPLDPYREGEFIKLPNDKNIFHKHPLPHKHYKKPKSTLSRRRPISNTQGKMIITL